MKKQTETEVKARKERVLAAAASVFFRYGYARTTIGDIAGEAKLHRPALYLLFAGGKDELFEAVLLRLVGGEVERYRREMPKHVTLGHKLFYCVEQWTMGGYRLTEKHPDARDAFNMEYPAVRKMYAVLSAFYAELLHEAAEESALGLRADQIASLLVFSVRGIRAIASDAASMRELLKQEVNLFLAALSAPASRADGQGSSASRTET